MENAAALILHFHLLVGVAVLQLIADMGDDIQGNLGGEGAAYGLFPGGKGLHLVFQLHQSCLTCPGYGLIGAGHHGLDGGEPGDTGHGHQRDDGGAVGVRDDALILEGVLAVDLRHHQGDLRVKAESGAVVDIDRTAFDDSGGKLSGHAVFHRAQHKIHALEAALRGLLNGHVLTVELDGASCASGAGKGQQLLYGNVVFLQNLQHLLAYGAGGAENGYIV